MNLQNLPLQLLADMALVILCSVPLLAIAGLPVLCVVAQLLGRAKQRSSYDKCARQLAQLTAILCCLLTLGGLWPLWQRVWPALTASPPAGADGVSSGWAQLTAIVMDSATLQADCLMWLTLFGAAVMLTMYHSMWRTMRDQDMLHQSLGLVGGFWCWLALYGITCIVSVDAAAELGALRPSSLEKLFMPSFETSFWNSAPYLPMLAIAMGAGLGGVWLILRRTKDDYGRDYYAQMLPWCALWARNGWLLLWLLLVAVTGMQWWPLLQSEDYLTAPEFIQNAVFLVLWIIPGLLWTLVTRSSSPLRHKTTMVLAFLLATGIIIPLYIGLIADIQ